jgi:hypothetical protein
MRRKDKEYSDHQRHQGRVARAAVCQNSGNRRVEQACVTPARRVQRQATANRAQEQERARTKRRENKERKLLAFYAKLQEAEARLGQDEEPSVQSKIHDKKLCPLAENNFDFDIFLDNPIMAAGKKMPCPYAPSPSTHQHLTHTPKAHTSFHKNIDLLNLPHHYLINCCTAFNC